jgi:hypothetical protein
LRHVADGLLDLLRLGGEVKASHAGAAASRREQPAQHADGSGLTGSVGAQEAKDLPTLDGQADVVDSDEVTETLDQVLDFYGDGLRIHGDCLMNRPRRARPR